MFGGCGPGATAGPPGPGPPLVVEGPVVGPEGDLVVRRGKPVAHRAVEVRRPDAVEGGGRDASAEQTDEGADGQANESDHEMGGADKGVGGFYRDEGGPGFRSGATTSVVSAGEDRSASIVWTAHVHPTMPPR